MVVRPSRGRPWRAGVASASIALGCAPAIPRTASDRTPAAESGLPPTLVGAEGSKAETAQKDDAADRVVAAALAETSRVRELAARGPVRGVTLSRKEMAGQVKRAVEREVPPDVVAAEGELLVALGVAPPSFDYAEAIISLMSAELAGYYEPSEKTMYLASDLGAPERAATLSHELVHALQDQHYDLGKLLDYHPDESDLQTAVHALAEGDATSAMLDQLLAPRGMKATDLPEYLLGIQVRAAVQFSSVATDVPDILKRSLVAPYIDGIGLVHFLRRRGGWAEVDRIWNAPPSSTEQLLHPEKLLAHEVPILVAVPVAPAGGPAGTPFTDVLGEQSVRLLLEEWLPRGSAEAAASGWGGDRLAVFHTDDRIAVAVHLRADSVDAAQRQAAALSRGVLAQGGSSERGNASCAERRDLGPLRVERRGRDVVLVAGPYRRTGAVVSSLGTCREAEQWASHIFAER